MAALNLAYPMAFQHNGLLYLVGYHGGTQYLRRSGDAGKTWLKFRDGEYGSAIAESDAERVAFVKMETQGSRIVVGIPRAPHVAVYVSSDDGETWTYEGEVG